MIWIDEIVDGIIETHGSNVFGICHELDIQIQPVSNDGSILYSSLKSNEAIYIRNALIGEIIYIKEGLDDQYREFIIAHELGHAILHTKVKQAAFDPELINLGKLEKQANYFALKLLSINIDPVEVENFTLDQISSLLHMPKNCMDLFSEINRKKIRI